MIASNKRYTVPVLSMVLMLCTLVLSGCFKDFKDDYMFRDNVLEFDLATWESKAPGKNYPVVGPVEKGSGVQNFQVNLIGEQKSEALNLQYRVVESETTLTEGVHFRLEDQGNFTIQPNSSTGEIAVEILDFPAESGTDTLVLELVPSGGVEVSENYKRIGIAVSLTGPPSDAYALHTQLGPESFYNSIYIDPMNPDLPQELRDLLDECSMNLDSYGDGSRSFQYLYIYFSANDRVNVVAQYFGGGGNGLDVGAYAIWTYDFALDAEGVGRFSIVESNGNGNAQRGTFAPILDYIEAHEFKVDWVDPSIAEPTREGMQLGGLFRTDDPSSYLIGSLEAMAEEGGIHPYPHSPAIQTLFGNGDAYYTTLLVNPNSPEQSTGFKQRWDDGKAYIEGLEGRQLHQMMFYFNPKFNFQDVRLVMYYYSSAGGKFLGQIRFLMHMDENGILAPLDYVYQDGNGRVTRAPELVDNFLMQTAFQLSRDGNQVRFTSVDDPTVYFEGSLGDNPLGVSSFWPE